MDFYVGAPRSLCDYQSFSTLCTPSAYDSASASGLGISARGEQNTINSDAWWGLN